MSPPTLTGTATVAAHPHPACICITITYQATMPSATAKATPGIQRRDGTRGGLTVHVDLSFGSNGRPHSGQRSASR